MKIRTGYSFRSAIGNLENVADHIKEINYPIAPITDRGSTFGFVKWRKQAIRVGLKPVFGVELAVSPSPTMKKPIVDYWTFIAKDNLRGIHDLVEIATNQFRYEPILTYQDAINAKDCIKIAGSRSLIDLVDPHKDIFVGWSPACSYGYLNAMRVKGFRFIPTSDNRFIKEGDEGLYNVICGRSASLQSYPQYIMSDHEWEALNDRQFSQGFIREMKSVTDPFMTVAEGFTADVIKAEILSPPKKDTLDQMCIDGAKNIGIDLDNPDYGDRLEYELSLIREKGFEDYFHIISDMAQWARKRMIVGPARGSSCGSLVCYLLQITTIDPVQYGLIFERFIDLNRNDPPDIDIDFSETRRDLVFDYMKEVYGNEHIARLGSVSFFKKKSAIKETGSALGMPPWDVDKISDAVGDGSIEDFIRDGHKLIRDRPEMEISIRVENSPRHYSQHAAGIVLTKNPVKDYIAVDARTGAAMCDKVDAEEIGLLKIDALGLTQLSIFEKCLEMAGLPLDHLDTIDLDDQKAFDVLKKGHFSGVFQFNGSALQNITKKIEIESLDDIIVITALARPGPMMGGGTSKWVDRRRGDRPVTYPDPKFEPILKDTLGVMVYQEQVMRIIREVGGFNWDDTTVVRKAMSKSLGAEFLYPYRKKFIKGCQSNGVSGEIADNLWAELAVYGAWAFNKSHSVAYGIISYWCCWLKAHYPVEYAAGMLTHENNPDRKTEILREMEGEGIGYVPVDKNLSIDEWITATIGGKRTLVGPLNNIKGVGPKMVGEIIRSRNEGGKLSGKVEKIFRSPVTDIDSLYPISDSVKKLIPDPKSRNIHTKPTKIVNIVQSPENQNFLAFGVFEGIRVKDENSDIAVDRRGYRVKGPHNSMVFRLKDDTGSIYAKINRYKYEQIAKEIIERGEEGEHLYCVKGYVPGNAKGFDFRMIFIDLVRHIGKI